MTVMCFVSRVIGGRGSPHDNNVLFASRTVGGRGSPHDNNVFFVHMTIMCCCFCFKSCWMKGAVHMTVMCFLFQELLEEEDSPHDSNATLKAKTLYKSCMNMSESVCLSGLLPASLSVSNVCPVSYTHLTLPTNHRV